MTVLLLQSRLGSLGLAGFIRVTGLAFVVVIGLAVTACRANPSPVGNPRPSVMAGTPIRTGSDQATAPASALVPAATETDLSDQRTPTEVAPSPTTVSAADLLQREIRSVARVKSGLGQGTAFAIRESDSDTLFLTNAHVVAGTSSVALVTADGTTHQGTVLGRDNNADLAIIAIPEAGIAPPLVMGESSVLRTGDPLYIIGFPLGSMLAGDASVTRGIVSGQRTVDGTSYVQTDAAVNPGDSGGPVLDATGQVVGVATWGVPSAFTQGLSFALPADVAREVVSQLLQDVTAPPTDGVWTVLPSDHAPSPRQGQSAIWTGREMVVWGGWDQEDFLGDGGRFDPTTNAWVDLSQHDAPSARGYAASVWTGREMLIWGGYSVDDQGHLIADNDGARYNPSTNAWTPLPRSPLSPRGWANGTWTGQQMLVWGGSRGTSLQREFLGDGARFDPRTNLWSPIAATGAPSPRWGNVAIWTGNRLLIWGGESGQLPHVSLPRDGALYDPMTNTWKSMSQLGAPSGRVFPSAVWTGREMIVWGGEDSKGELSDGARYDPVADTWTSLSSLGAPSARSDAGAVWTGNEMLVWGGTEAVTNAPATGANGATLTFFGDGGRYDPVHNRWSPFASFGAPPGRYHNATVWTGHELLVWGGFGNGIGVLRSVSGPEDDGGVYRPPTAVPLEMRPASTPTPAIKQSGETAEPRASWNNRADLYSARSALAVVTAPNGHLYAIGGMDANLNPVSTVEEYDPATDAWTNRDPMPTARGFLGAVVGQNGKIYAIGGSVGRTVQPSATLEEYDPRANAWVTRAPMHVPRMNLAVAAASNGKIYAFGGDPKDTVEEYNPATDTWRLRTSLPAQFTNFQIRAAAANGKVYVLAADGRSPLSVAAYDPATNIWETKASGGIAREDFTVATSSSGDIFVVGGISQGSPAAGWVEQYSPSTDTWHMLPSLPAPLDYPGAAVGADGTLYVVGGTEVLAGGQVSKVEALAP